ncbi:MAG: selenium-dependent molybdenum cofactor biosynthesis protein YqeB [Defluviitaleaceae bacterium]|nr:selenium-dependent molybdenum cofactor biosynthesis protein YqeB [Defluviitaleaceae bacterium]
MRDIVIIRGGGDIATGCVQALRRAGFGVIVLETGKPTAIRRGVSLSDAVYRGSVTVEDMTAIFCERKDIERILAEGNIPVLTDPRAETVSALKPFALVDAILAKRNTGTYKGMARVTVGLGPGFAAPDDVDIVIETMRGHDLGRLITHGAAMANTGIPTQVDGAGAERVIYAPAAGALTLMREIGDTVGRGQILARVGGADIPAPISGVLRGILPDGFEVRAGLKLADIDPRGDRESCFTISDKARCIGGAVLTAVMSLGRRHLFDNHTLKC